MTIDWTSVLVQAPIVAGFIWFALELTKRYATTQEFRDKQWQEFFASQRTLDREALKDFGVRFDKMSEQLGANTQAVATITATMEMHDRHFVAANEAPQAKP